MTDYRRENLQCRTGLIIRKLVLDDSTTDSDIWQPNWSLQAPVSLKKSSIQQLFKTDEAGSIITELVYVEYKPFELGRGASKPSSSVMQRMCHLETLLRQPKAAENGFRTLRCSSVVQENCPEKIFVFVYEFPSPSQIPVSLNEAIDSRDFKTLVRPTLTRCSELLALFPKRFFDSILCIGFTSPFVVNMYFSSTMATRI